MSPQKNRSVLRPSLAIPTVLGLAVVVGVLTNRTNGAKSIPTSAPVTASANASAAGSGTLESILALSPEALLQALPDSGAQTAAAREIKRWQAAARTAPQTTKNWVNLGDALMQRSRELVDPHYYDFAQAAYTIAMKQDPKNVESLLGMAWVSGGRHQFDKSIDFARQAIALNPNAPGPYGLIGDAQVETGDYDAAFESYQKMLDLRPDAASYSRGAHLLFLTGNTQKALQLMSLAVKTGGPYNENTAWCKAQLADMMWQMGMLMPAEIVAKQAERSAPDNYYVQTALGHIREAKGEHAAAEEAYKKAISLSPQHAALVALGDLYLAEGKTAQAEQMFEQVDVTNAHHQQHGNHDQYYMAGFYADHDRKLDQAQQIIASRAPRSPVDQEIAAWVCFKTGRLAEAKTHIDAALEKGSPTATRFFRAGMIYARSGDRKRGQQLLNDALAKNPHFNILQAKVCADTLQEIGTRPPVGQTVAAIRAAKAFTTRTSR